MKLLRPVIDDRLWRCRPVCWTRSEFPCDRLTYFGDNSYDRQTLVTSLIIPDPVWAGSIPLAQPFLKYTAKTFTLPSVPSYHSHVSSGEVRRPSLGCCRDRGGSCPGPKEMGFNAPPVPTWPERSPNHRQHVRFPPESDLGGICEDGQGTR